MNLFFTSLARRIRHAPLLRRCEGFWSFLRPAYFRLLDPFSRGVEVRLARRSVRFPAELLSTNPDWSHYETETLSTLATWLDSAGDRPVLLDVGCSFGAVTSFALQLSPTLEVLAFDSDLMSLRALEAVVSPASMERVRRVHGLLGREHTSGFSLPQAVETTLRHLPPLAPRTAISRSGFVCFGDNAAASVPEHQLDALLASAKLGNSILLKCDVEGAELLVLQGARALLARCRPALLLSVHPSFLPRFGHTSAQVQAFLDDAGYSVQLIGRDHEEHWWCLPRAA